MVVMGHPFFPWRCAVLLVDFKLAHELENCPARQLRYAHRRSRMSPELRPPKFEKEIRRAIDDRLIQSKTAVA